MALATVTTEVLANDITVIVYVGPLHVYFKIIPTAATTRHPRLSESAASVTFVAN